MGLHQWKLEPETPVVGNHYSQLFIHQHENITNENTDLNDELCIDLDGVKSGRVISYEEVVFV